MSDDDLSKLLRTGQTLLLKYPAAARAAVRAFIAEGRRYAQTEEGKQARAALDGSSILRRGRLVFEGCSLNMLEDDEDNALLPSVVLEAVMAAAASNRLEGMLSELYAVKGEDADPR